MAVLMSLGDLQKDVTAKLREMGISDAAHEARLIVGHYAGVETSGLISAANAEVSDELVAMVRVALKRRAKGEPVHRILGRRAFYNIELAISPATLEPRPDTEILVDRIIPHVRRIIDRDGSCRLLDLGTGTGAIALALLAEIKELVAVGVDIDDDAVSTAQANARANGLDARFGAIRSDWFAEITEKFHVIVSNPPYITAEEFEALSPEVSHFDPKTALIGGLDGLDAYRAIAGHAACYLLPGGIVGVEIGHLQRAAVSAIFAQHAFQLLEQTQDLAGKDRVLLFACEP